MQNLRFHLLTILCHTGTQVAVVVVVELVVFVIIIITILLQCHELQIYIEST